MIHLLIRHLGFDPIRAMRGSEGWGGDTAVVLQGPGGALSLVWKTLWDTPRDARQFADAWQWVAARQAERGLSEARSGRIRPLKARREEKGFVVEGEESALFDAISREALSAVPEGGTIWHIAGTRQTAVVVCLWVPLEVKRRLWNILAPWALFIRLEPFLAIPLQ